MITGEHGEDERCKTPLVRRDKLRANVDILEESLRLEVNTTYHAEHQGLGGSE